jgi:sugar/nucleoside kinase (ribokinase family)
MAGADCPVVVAGHICFDIIPAFLTPKGTSLSSLFVPGKLINMGPMTFSSGGPVSNTGIGLKILGVNAALMGKAGDDMLGENLLQFLKKRDVAEGMAVVPGEQTSYTVVISPPGVDRVFLHNPGANNTFSSKDVDYDRVSRAKVFHFGYPPLMRTIQENRGRELVKIFKRVKSLGVATSLDMSLPDPNSESGRVDWRAVYQDLLPWVDFYLGSIEETMFILDRPQFDQLNARAKGHDPLNDLDLDSLPPLGKTLLEMGTRVAVMKCGWKGYYIRTSDEARMSEIGRSAPADLENWAGRELHCESFHVPNVATATGAGDSSIAGFWAAYLRGLSIEQCIEMACAVGGCNVTAFDAISGLKSWDETTRLVKDGWPRNRLDQDESYWKYDQPRALRIGAKDRTRRAEKRAP